MTAKNPRLWVTVTEPYVKAVDDLVKVGVYLTRGEALRAALRLLMKEHGIILTPEEAAGW